MTRVTYMYELNQGRDSNGKPLNNLEDQQALRAKILEANKDFINEILFSKRLPDIPVIGDFVSMKDGTFARFTVFHEKQQSFQVVREGESGFFLYPDGSCEQSGTCGFDFVKIAQVEFNCELKEGSVWMFDRGIVAHGNRIDFKVPFRVWEFKTDLA